MTKMYYADTLNFDNHRTGLYPTREQAEAAFWEESWFSAEELKRVRVYTCEVEVPPSDGLTDADIVALADEHADAMFEDRGEAAYGRDD